MVRPALESITEQSHDRNATAQTTTTNLLDLMQGTRLTDASRGTSGSPPGDQQPPARPCESSPVYERYIDDVARRIFDPASLGNLDQLKTKYNCEIETSQNPMKFVKQALDRDDNDPYTSYLTPKEFQKIVEAQRGKVMGAGVTFVMPTALEDKTGARPPLIVQDFEGTTKRGHGIQPGDQILAVDGVSMQGKSWRDGLRALDGAENTKVKLHIKRNGTESDVELTRTNEDGVNVTSQMLDNKFAHIRVREFINNHTSNQIESAILDNPKAEGYILDLRHNPGGLLDQAFTSASLFIKEGEVLKIKSRIPSDPADPKYSINTYSLSKDLITIAQDASMPIAYKARHQDRVDKPVVVLIDQGTASAAEILAGALKDTDGAYVIGTPSYGKGVGQEIGKDIPTGGALKITTFRYYTPSGFWPGDGHATRIGISPNLIVDNPKPADYYTQRDGQLNAAVSYLRTAK